MNAIRSPFVLLWKGWFYLVILIVILLIFPFIWYWSRRESDYDKFFWWARVWARMVLFASFLPVKVKRETDSLPEQCIVVSNHTSMLDILMNLFLYPNAFLFIGKIELARLPLFGFFYKRTNILVNRSSLRSRKEAMDKASEKLDQGYSMCIYPEGGVPDHEVLLGNFKEGAFRFSIEKQLPLLPITFIDNKRAFPYKWNLGGPRVLRATIHKAVYPEGKNAKELKEEIRCIFIEEFKRYNKS